MAVQESARIWSGVFTHNAHYDITGTLIVWAFIVAVVVVVLVVGFMY